jgi:hypothetical protein
VTRSRLLTLAAALVLTATSASADMTMKLKMTMAGPMSIEMGTTLYIKGMKMRTDASMAGQDVSLIVDLATKQRLMLQHSTKTVQEIAAMSAASPVPMTVGDISVAMTPTGGKKAVLGRDCDGYTVRVVMPMTMGDETLTMTIAGPVWVAKEAPGMEDYKAFYKAAAATGLELSPFAQGPQGKGMTEMVKVMLDSGMPLEQDMELTVEGTGQMAQVMGKMAMSMSSQVTELTADPIPDDTFAVPADYTKKH